MSDNTPDNDDLIEDSEEDFEGEETNEALEAPTAEAAAAGNVVSILPVHAAPYTGARPEGGGRHLKVARRPGRPRKVERMPSTSDLEYHAKMTEEKAKFIDQDSVVVRSRTKAEPLEILAAIKMEVAKESASLHFQRIELEKYGKDTSQVSSRRIDALKKIADIELEIRKMGGDTIDVHSERMQRIFKFFIETVKETLQETLSVEEIDMVFNRLGTRFDGWQEKLAEILR